MSATNVLRVSVLSNGDLLLDGQPLSLSELERAMEQGAKAGAAVWYYRQNGAGEPPKVAMEVMRLITVNRLPVRLSTQPDFSGTIAPSKPSLWTAPAWNLFHRAGKPTLRRRCAIRRSWYTIAPPIGYGSHSGAGHP